MVQLLMVKRKINHTLLIFCLKQDSRRNIKILHLLEFQVAICLAPLRGINLNFYLPILVLEGDIVTYFGAGGSFYFSCGIELKPDNRLTLRLGSSSHRSGYLTGDFSSDIIAGFSGGVGFRFTNMTLDVGFMNLGPAGFVVGFSLMKKLN